MSETNKADELYTFKRIISLMNRVKELYEEEEFFAAYGLSLVINRLLTNTIEESE